MICDKFISLIASKVTNVSVGKIQHAKYYSIVVDSTLHACHVDQLACVIRYMTNDSNTVERFLCLRFQVLTAASMMFRIVFPDDGGSTHL
jgi:hypothetical protein